jgi:hypothetical protein
MSVHFCADWRRCGAQVETLWNRTLTPFGAHKPWFYFKGDKLRQLYERCPELHGVNPVDDFDRSRPLVEITYD